MYGTISHIDLHNETSNIWKIGNLENWKIGKNINWKIPLEELNNPK
jgi:hypothetical protein